MNGFIIIFGFFFLSFAIGKNTSTIEKSNSEIYDPKNIFINEKTAMNLKNMHPLELIIGVRNYSHSQISGKEKKKHRRERIRKRKDRGGKYFRQKNKLEKPFDDVASHIIRNKEKTTLIRNKTIEILKSGLRMLSSNENRPQNDNKTSSKINETLLEKILSSAVTKKDVLSSATGAYKVPVGFEIYEPREIFSSNSTLNFPEKNYNKSGNIKEPNKHRNKDSEGDYDYEYDVPDTHSNNKNNELSKFYKSMDYESINTDVSIGAALEKIADALKNLTNCSSDCSKEKNTRDLCQKWLDCRQTFDKVFLVQKHSLPSCPCTYPSSIFYDEVIWDKKQEKYFRWRDASSEVERLDIYKPGAAYCIRSLLTQGSLSLSSQQCCYDRSLRLLTRGSGAGTINFMSPDVSKKLHFTVDILPWRFCKGDFTRYNEARSPDNGNNCPNNPDEQQYQLQVKLSKIF